MGEKDLVVLVRRANYQPVFLNQLAQYYRGIAQPKCMQNDREILALGREEKAVLNASYSKRSSQFLLSRYCQHVCNYVPGVTAVQNINRK